VEADEALAAFAQELVRGVISLTATGNVPGIADAPLAPPPARTGAGAVHPHLGHHLVTAVKGDTISGHAYKHVPRPYELDATQVKLAEQHQQLEAQEKALQGVRDYRSAARELDQHSAQLHRDGIALPGTWRAWTPDERASHARHAEDSLVRALASGKATTATETLDGTGQVWKPERAARHRDIVHQFLEDNQGVPSGHQAVLVGGLHGTHREQVAAKAAPAGRYLHVRTDDIKREMAARGMVPHLAGLSPMEASPLVHDEAEHVAHLLAREAVRRGKNVAIHTAMSDPDAIRAHVDQLHREGHSVHAAFAHVDPGKAADAARALHASGHEKFRRQEDHGQKYLPPSLVRAADAGNGETVNSRAFEAAKRHLGSWESWDATSGSLRKSGSSGDRPRRGIPAPEDFLNLTADGAVRLGAILGWLEKGRITLADAAGRIRAMQLGHGQARSPHQVLAADANGDLPVPDGSTFAEVGRAYVAGRISRHQYEVLAAAAVQRT
jgi:predicted kinase